MEKIWGQMKKGTFGEEILRSGRERNAKRGMLFRIVKPHEEEEDLESYSPLPLFASFP